jgi:hypothetical protein
VLVDAQAEASPTALWRELRSALTGVLRATLALALAEGKLAVLSSLSMVALAVLAAATLFGAWLLLALALVYGAAELGAPLWAACAGLALLHILLAVGLWVAARRLVHNLEFSETRRVIAESWTRHASAIDSVGDAIGRAPAAPPAQRPTTP